MRKLLILTVCALFVTSGFTIRTFLIGGADGQDRPQNAQNQNPFAQSSATRFDQWAKQPGKQAGNTTQNKWEYKTLRCSVGTLDAQANALGEDGWELCSTSPGSESTQIICIFKRPKLDTVNLSSYTLDGLAERRTTTAALTPSPNYLVFNLKRANASDVAEVLKSALKNVVVVIDPRSNSVHVQCPNADANAIKLLIETLDKAAKQETQPESPPRANRK